MADSSTSPNSTERSSQQPESDNANSKTNQSDALTPSSTPPNPSPNPIPPPAPPYTPVISPPQPLPSAQPYSVAAPSFWPSAPVSVPSSGAPRFSPLPNPNMQPPNYQTAGVPPPGVSYVPPVLRPPVPSSGSLSLPVSSVPPPYGQPLNPATRPYAPPLLNGFQPIPQGTFPSPGLPHYTSPYTPMVRMAFPPRPPGAVGMFPTALRPPIPGLRAPVIPPIIRPATVPNIIPTEKPQTTVYIGKIASTIENDFMLSILQLCGPVKSWKRPQDTTSGTLKGFGFCEFESAEGVLRALRLLSKLNVDGQELMLNVDEATKKYLCCYVENREKNSENLKASENEVDEKKHGGSLDAEKNDTQKPSIESPKSDTGDSKKEENDPAKKDAIVNFGILNNQDREADQEAVAKLTGMIEERVKTRPPPPPPPPPLPSQATADGLGNSNSDLAVILDVGVVKNDATNGKNDDEMNSESKRRGEQDRPETSSPDRSRRYDRRSRDRERDLKRDKERELERYEREREQERLRREREMEYKIREDERRFKARVKDWESRERKKKRLREEEEEIAKERKQDREWVIQEQESENDDTYSKRRKYKNNGEERTRRLREKEEDLADRLKEEEETAEATSRAQEDEHQWKEREESLELLAGQEPNGNDTGLPNIPDIESKNVVLHQIVDHDSDHDNHIVAGGKIVQNGSGDELIGGSVSAPDMLQGSNAPARKLGFGLVGSGKRTTVPSVFNQEEDEDAQKEKKMRPLVPIDYSTDELQAVQTSAFGALSPNLAAAAEFAKRISNANPKEERFDAEKEKVQRSVERSSQRDRERYHEESNRRRDESREILYRDRDREHKPEKLRTTDNQKLLDAKQLIDMIPKTKDELFSFDINWAIYDKNKLHERMRPWISKKITEFLGEEEETLVSYIVSSTREHVKASEMLERLQAILDDEAEMFVLKMWRMLIFEIKRVESGLALRSKS